MAPGVLRVPDWLSGGHAPLSADFHAGTFGATQPLDHLADSRLVLSGYLLELSAGCLLPPGRLRVCAVAWHFGPGCHVLLHVRA